MTERWLIRRILSGDRRAAQVLVERAYPVVYRMMKHLTSHREVAEDLTQQAFIKAWKGLPEFRADSSFVTWVRRIAYREYLHWRRDRPQDLHIRDDFPGVDALREGTERLVLEAAIARLPEELRVTFVLVAVEELAVREAAIALEIPEGTVKSRMFTARKRLREYLQPSATSNQNDAHSLLVNEVQP